MITIQTASYFDSHAHYDDKRFDGDRDEMLSRLLPESGVNRVINVGADMGTSRASIDLAEKYPYIYASVGIHPHAADHMADGDLDALLTLSRHPKVLAVGETGLDYYYNLSGKEAQRACFRAQLRLARETALPVIIHSRDAALETYTILKESGVSSGVIHCFSGDAALALDYAALGFYIAFGGAITFPKNTDAVSAAAALPMERILLETDAPYIAPVPYRGKRNDSRNLAVICARLAEIKGITPGEAARATWDNAERLFNK